QRLLARVGPFASALISAPASEALSASQRREAMRSCQLTGAKAQHWAGVSAGSVADLLDNLEYAMALGAEAAVFDPMSALDCPDPLKLLHRHVLPFFERLGRSLPLVFKTHGMERRLRTADLKQLARLELLQALVMTAPAAAVSNYLKGAR